MGQVSQRGFLGGDRGRNPHQQFALLGDVSGLVGMQGEHPLPWPEAFYRFPHPPHHARVRIPYPAWVLGSTRNVSRVSQVIPQIGAGRKGGDFRLDINLVGF